MEVKELITTLSNELREQYIFSDSDSIKSFRPLGEFTIESIFTNEVLLESLKQLGILNSEGTLNGCLEELGLFMY